MATRGDRNSRLTRCELEVVPVALVPVAVSYIAVPLSSARVAASLSEFKMCQSIVANLNTAYFISGFDD